MAYYNFYFKASNTSSNFSTWEGKNQWMACS